MIRSSAKNMFALVQGVSFSCIANSSFAPFKNSFNGAPLMHLHLKVENAPGSTETNPKTLSIALSMYVAALYSKYWALSNMLSGIEYSVPVSGFFSVSITSISPVAAPICLCLSRYFTILDIEFHNGTEPQSMIWAYSGCIYSQNPLKNHL